MQINIIYLLIVIIVLLIYKLNICNIKTSIENLNKTKIEYNKYFITFGGGPQNYIESGKRLIKQAQSLKLFNKTTLYTDNDLKSDYNFWKKHGDFINNNKRGYGYWIWKPYIIKKTIELMNDGDILLYLDSGCEIDIKKKQKINKYFEYVKKDYIIARPTSREKDWNKMDLIIYLNMNDSNILNTSQRAAGAILFYINKQTRNLVNTWYNIGCNYHMIDDSKSIIPNLNSFKEHRHDQSIFSLLTKKYNIYSKRNIRNCIEIIRNNTSKNKFK